jgi:type IV pilus assembly protein PilA
MAANWFYADAQNQQQGPVERNWLSAAYRDGTVLAGTLVWREGLPGWVPLSQVAAELHLVIVGAVPPLRSSSTPGRPRIVKPASSGSWVLIAVIVGMGFVMVIAILAAIALPAYQNYTVRAKIMSAVVSADALKVEVAEFYSVQNRCPKNDDDGFDPAEKYATNVIAAIHVGPIAKTGECAVQVVLKYAGALETNGKKITMMMNAQGQWHTTSDLPARYLPLSMRQSATD